MNKLKCAVAVLCVGSATTTFAADPLPKSIINNKGQSCLVKTVCPSLHPHVHHKPKVPVISHDSMCWEFPITIIREPVVPVPPDLVPITLDMDVPVPEFNIPDDQPGPIQTAWNWAGGVADDIFGGSGNGSNGGGYIGGGGGGGRPGMSAPEIDPSSAVSALTLLIGGITIIVSKRR